MSVRSKENACGATRSKNAKSLKTLSGARCGATAEQAEAYMQVIENIAEQDAELAGYKTPIPLCVAPQPLGALRATQQGGKGVQQ